MGGGGGAGQAQGAYMGQQPQPNSMGGMMPTPGQGMMAGHPGIYQQAHQQNGGANGNGSGNN